MTIDFYGNAFRLVSKRWAYVRADRLAAAFQDPGVLDAVIVFTEVPDLTSATLRTLPMKQKVTLIVDHFRYLQRTPTSKWHRHELAEIWAAHVYKAGVDEKVRAATFFPVQKEAALVDPVEAWMRADRLDPAREVPMGTKRADVVGYAKAMLFAAERIATVELKNDMVALERVFAQFSEYRRHSTRMYLAVTPSFVLHYSWRNVESRGVSRWSSKALEERLQALGAGLLIVEGPDVIVAHEGKELSPADLQRQEVRAVIAQQRTAAAQAVAR